MIVAIDGPSGSGKSTTAWEVAKRLGWLYLDTGAMYRAIGIAFRDHGVDSTEEAAEELVPTLTVDLEPGAEAVRVLLNGDDVTDRIRTPEAADVASRVSALATIRTALIQTQRRIAQQERKKGSGVVIEGRDIGTVVFPNAEVKFFFTADLDTRARRRLKEGNGSTTHQQVRKELAARDRRDMERELSPLVAASDAIHLDTTNLSIEEQVQRVLDAVEQHRSATF